MRASYDRALAYMASVSGMRDVDAGRLLMYLIGKSLMVDEASTGLQHVEAVLGKGCAGKGGPQLQLQIRQQYCYSRLRCFYACT